MVEEWYNVKWKRDFALLNCDNASALIRTNWSGYALSQNTCIITHIMSYYLLQRIPSSTIPNYWVQLGTNHIIKYMISILWHTFVAKSPYFVLISIVPCSSDLPATRRQHIRLYMSIYVGVRACTAEADVSAVWEFQFDLLYLKPLNTWFLNIV